MFSRPPRIEELPPPTSPPNPPPVVRTSLDPAPPRAPARTVPVRTGFNPPPLGETRFVPDEVLLDVPANVSGPRLNSIAARFGLTRLEQRRSSLTGRTLHRWRINAGSGVADTIRTLAGAQQILGAQPNYLYALQQVTAPNSDQYAPAKLSLFQAHRIATGNRVLVAVVDSGVDLAHPDIASAIVANYDAVTDDTRPHAHGTGMAGAIAARRTVLGAAPRVALLTVRAFSMTAASAEGTTYNILKGLDWSAERGARIINMSFAGPPDPRLRDAMRRATQRGIVLIAAAGNQGPRSPPLYPAADPNVIAVTATDINDALFRGANRGRHIAVAAPGVDILVPTVGGSYQFTTGTSVAAAHVSGVAALLIERNPSLTPADVRRILMRTARTLGQGENQQDFGAGLVDAFQAVSAAGERR